MLCWSLCWSRLRLRGWLIETHINALSRSHALARNTTDLSINPDVLLPDELIDFSSGYIRASAHHLGECASGFTSTNHERSRAHHGFPNSSSVGLSRPLTSTTVPARNFFHPD